MLPTLDLGPVVLPSAGVVYLLAIWIGLSLVERAARRPGLDVEATYNLATIGLVAAFLGARLAFVLWHWPAYQANPIGIIWPLNSGYYGPAGLLAGAAAALLYGRRKQLRPWPTLDALAPGLVAGLIAVSLADFLAGPGYGTETAMPWAISQFGAGRHPVQLYEIAAGLAAWLAWRRLARRPTTPGHPFLVATAITSAGRLLFEAYRANGWLTDGGYHVVQLLCLVILLGAVFLLTGQALSDT
jgi:phosphatidylglycerol:prolipoprotein diacylglycerol transferase